MAVLKDEARMKSIRGFSKMNKEQLMVALGKKTILPAAPADEVDETSEVAKPDVESESDKLIIRLGGLTLSNIKDACKRAGIKIFHRVKT